MRSAAASVLIIVSALLVASPPADAARSATLGATYAATVPATAAAGSTASMPVTLQNTGNETWNFQGPGPVYLAYHWENEGGAIVEWEGVRTSLLSDVPPGASRTVNATVVIPTPGGNYGLRFHLVKEGVLWFPQMSARHAVTVESPYAVRFGSVPIFTYLTGTTHMLQVPVTNIGTATWNASGTAPIVLSYHWHDSGGRLLVWDGLRTALPADVAPGASTTITARIRTPDGAASPVMLTLDLVREGVAWFEFLGGTPVRFHTTIESPRWSARYDAPASFDAKASSEPILMQVTVTNTGNVTWEANSELAMSYHVFDADGRLLTWDGRRTSMGGELRPGMSRTISVTYNIPSAAGTYYLNTEAVREGIAWLSNYGSPPAQTRLTVLP